MRAFDVGDDAVTVDSGLELALVRTDRVERDGRAHPLPAHLGRIVLRKAEKFARQLPTGWATAESVFAPVYQGEAFWIELVPSRPHAVQLEIGGRNTLDGRTRAASLRSRPQNYIVALPQKAIDGTVLEAGRVEQFIAVPLPPDAAVDAPSLRIRIIPPKLGSAAAKIRINPFAVEMGFDRECNSPAGAIEQEIVRDPFGIDAWEIDRAVTVDIFFIEAHWFARITGESPPLPPLAPPIRVT